MTIHAYQETYLSKAQASLGEAFDYAINTCGIPGEDFIKLFTASTVSKRIENGEAAYLSGKSGIEIAADVIFETTSKLLNNEPRTKAGRSREYWIGWAVSYYQWFSGRSFMDILKAVPLNQIVKMYSVYHEMDISHMVERMDGLLKDYFPFTRLRTRRENCGLSQSQLAADSGVALRQIQLFEQKQRDINKTAAATLLRLSRSLHCRIEDLMEFSTI